MGGLVGERLLARVDGVPVRLVVAEARVGQLLAAVFGAVDVRSGVVHRVLHLAWAHHLLRRTRTVPPPELQEVLLVAFHSLRHYCPLSLGRSNFHVLPAVLERVPAA